MGPQHTPHLAAPAATCTACAHFSSVCVSFFRDRMPSVACAKGRFPARTPQNSEDFFAIASGAKACGQYRRAAAPAGQLKQG